ncbi:MAG: tetratricopeptide repeat protein [Sphingobacteriaceae bacterium]|nr:tetratricopeptide repeat protein [Sphingobacteriaceae bacterium]
MKKNLSLLVFCVLSPFYLSAQEANVPDLIFNKKFYDCEDNWVVFPKKPADSVYSYGFVYLDMAAGFTFDLQGQFFIEKGGKFVAKAMERLKTSSMKYRLAANTSLVAQLSGKRLMELNLPKEPVWLKGYKAPSESVSTLTNMGRHYNHVGALDKAAECLVKAYSLDPHFKGVEFELSYNHNAKGQYENAIKVLKGAIKNDSKNFWFYRELGYAYMNLGKLDEAEKVYSTGIEISNDVSQKAEMAYNMTLTFFQKEKKEKCKEWIEKTRSFASADSPYLKSLLAMEKKLNQ